MPDTPIPPSHPHILSKPFASTRSCQNLLCLTKRCYQQQATKQKILNSQYFQKLSLKQFNNNPSVMNNQSFYEKGKELMKRDKSTDDSEFRNVVINSNEQQIGKYTVDKHGNYHHEKTHSSSFYNQFSNQPTHRIIRSSSYHQLQSPQLQLNTSIIQLNHSLEQQVEMDYKKISDLAKLRNRLQKEIQQLDHNIDQYYGVYQVKIDELKKIQSRIKAVEKGGKGQQRERDINREKVLRRVPSTDQLGGRFMKKPYVGKVETSGQTIRQAETIGEHTARRTPGSGMSNAIYMKTEQKNNITKSSCSFFKKTN